MIKKTLVSIFSTFLLISIPYLPSTFAQNYTKWNLPEGAKVRLGKGWISGDIAYSPDGTRLAVSSSIGIWVYDANTFTEIALLRGHTDHIHSVAFSPDGKMLVSGAHNDKKARVWDIHTGELLVTLDGHSGGIDAVAFSPDGKTIGTMDGAQEIRLWDIDTRQHLYTLKDDGIWWGSVGSVNCLAFSPDGKRVAGGYYHGRIRFWDVSTGKKLGTAEHSVYWGVNTLAFSSDGITLASGGGNNRVYLLGARTGIHWQTLRGHSGDVNSVVFSPDDKILVSGSNDGTVRLWDGHTGKALRTLTGHKNSVLSVAFSPNGNTLASADWEEIRFWDSNTGKLLRVLEGHTRTVNSIALSPDGSTLVSGHQDGTIQLWNPHSGELLNTIERHAKAVNSVSFSPDGRTLASGGLDNRAVLWNTSNWEHLYTLDEHTEGVNSVTFSSDSSKLASGFQDGKVQLWNPRSGELLRTFKSGESVNSVAFSPDDKMLASGHDDKQIRLWDVQTGRRLQNIPTGQNEIYSVAFSPDGSTLASIGKSKIIRLWNPDSGKLLHTLRGHTEQVLSVVFSPDGSTLASASWRTIRLRDARTWEHLHTLDGHMSWILSVAFFPDSETLVSGSSDGTILLWNLTPSDTPSVPPSTPITSNTVVSISPPQVQSPAIGQQLTLSLKIEKGEDVAGYQATVEFDATTLRYVESTNGDYLPKGAFFVPPVSEGNTVTLASTTLGGKSDGSGTLATITFEVVAAKASTVRLSDVLLTDSAGGSSTPQIENADITEPPQLPEDVNKDGVVNIIDLTLVASSFGKSGQNSADVNGDGIVNIIDLTLVAAAFGNTAAAPEVWSRHTEVTPTREQVEQWLHQARQMNLTDSTFQRGLLMLEQLLAILTPKETALLPNYPNPFNPETWIPYQLAESADVSISIYAVDGTLVRTLALGHQAVGIYESRSHAAYWDGKNAFGEPVASSVYFYTLTAGDFTATRKMLIMK